MNGSLDVYGRSLTPLGRKLVDALVGENVMLGAADMAALANALGIRMRQARAEEDLQAYLFCLACIERLSLATMLEIAVDNGTAGHA